MEGLNREMYIILC